MLAAAIHQQAPDDVRPPAHPTAGDTGRQRKPHRRRGVTLAMLFGLFGAAAVWVLQTEIGEALSAQACYPHREALPAPQWPWLMPALSAASLGALLIGMLGAGVAWWNWRRARDRQSDTVQQESDASRGRTRFLAMAALMLSLLFLVGLVATGFAVLIVSPCSAWR
ncbi:hypothetical protein VOM14_30825 [Paraburkholderia sp. MPAMCS5]|uniref:hypothetical protein n=1 Tax=Paraburkholderia sp. MPAMCS5 TaxID=3112563 RepID=UPI002E171BF5|nr:hypothetical protein [Paraburkholderia sp. MPAMCS5]